MRLGSVERSSAIRRPVRRSSSRCGRQSGESSFPVHGAVGEPASADIALRTRRREYFSAPAFRPNGWMTPRGDGDAVRGGASAARGDRGAAESGHRRAAAATVARSSAARRRVRPSDPSGDSALSGAAKSWSARWRRRRAMEISLPEKCLRSFRHRSVISSYTRNEV